MTPDEFQQWQASRNQAPEGYEPTFAIGDTVQAIGYKNLIATVYEVSEDGLLIRLEWEDGARHLRWWTAAGYKKVRIEP